MKVKITLVIVPKGGTATSVVVEGETHDSIPEYQGNKTLILPPYLSGVVIEEIREAE